MSLPEENPRCDPSGAAGVERRKVLGTMGLAGLGWLATSATSAAFPNSGSRKGSPIVRVPTSSGASSTGATWFSSGLDVPEEWAANNRSADAYHRYIKSLNLRRVDAGQVVASHAKAKGRVWNALPPKAWWKRMGYVLKVVDRIAIEMNVSEVEVISAYRTPAYNARCRGAKSGSWHQQNVAADVKFPVSAYRVTAMARELRRMGLFRGGVGGYWNFTHIDARGKNVNW